MNFLTSVSNWVAGFFDKRLWYTVGDGKPTVARETVSVDSALNYSAVWAATTLICGTGASLPLPVYSGKLTGERNRERAHKVHKLLNENPNSEMTAFAFRTLMWKWQVNGGNAFAEIVREGDDPDGAIVSLWPIHPSRVGIHRDEDTGELFYSVKNKPGQPPTPVSAWRIWHIPSIITDDGIVGHGVISHASETIGAAVATEKYAANWFGGAAVPRAVIEHAGKWDDEARKAFADEWEDIYSGPEGRRVAVLQGGATMKTLSLSAEDSQFLQTRQFGVEEIARWYGIPPHLLQHLLNATLNNVEQLGISFVQYCLMLWLKSWEQSISFKLLTEAERADMFAEHVVDALLRGDTAARSEFYKSMVSAALMTRNECRRLENLEPVPGGDTFLVQGAQVPLDDEGRPESRFVNPDTSSTAGTVSPPDPSSGVDTDGSIGPVAVASVVGRLKRIISHDLSRFLTKETKAIANFAKKPNEFVTLVDTFYSEHIATVTDEMTETFGALRECGLEVSTDVFVTSWIRDGKELVLNASGTATPAELHTIIQQTTDSRTWTERPLRAVEAIS